MILLLASLRIRQNLSFLQVIWSKKLFAYSVPWILLDMKILIVNLHLLKYYLFWQCFSYHLLENSYNAKLVVIHCSDICDLYCFFMDLSNNCLLTLMNNKSKESTPSIFSVHLILLLIEDKSLCPTYQSWSIFHEEFYLLVDFFLFVTWNFFSKSCQPKFPQTHCVLN